MTTQQPFATSASTTKMVAEGISKTFASDGHLVGALEDVTLSVAPGEFLCVLGPSGCGKSTLLSILAGFLSPTSGSVLIDDEPVTGPDPRRIFVFQERSVFPWLTVKANVGFGLAKLPQSERDSRVAYYVELVGLKGFENSYPGELSGGMKQRLEVARALAVKPDMLFLDEPFGSLDFITRVEMRKELLRIWQAQKTTVICVTHDVDEAVQLADRIIILSPRPAKIQKVVKVDLPHSRDISSPRYLEIRDGIFEQIGLSHRI